MLHWAVTGRPAPAAESRRRETTRPRTGPVLGGATARRRRRYLRATGLRGEPSPLVSGSGVASSRNV